MPVLQDVRKLLQRARAVQKSQWGKEDDNPSKFRATTEAKLIAWSRVLLDVSAVLAALALAYPLRFGLHLLSLGDLQTPPPIDIALSELLWLSATLGALYSNRLYDEDTLFYPGGGENRRINRSVIEATAVFATIIFLIRNGADSRGWFLFVVLLTLIFVHAERIALARILRSHRQHGHLRRPAALVARPNSPSPSWLDGLSEFSVVAHLTVNALLDTAQAARSFDRLPAGTIIIVDDESVSDEDLWKIVLTAGEWNCPTFVGVRLPSISRDRLSTRDLWGRSIVKYRRLA